ncbi:Hsp70 family protein [Psychrobacter piscatorii]|uniref:Hsp70 family protein n=1 Tax=Psychrobacter piscatorii TaxID=554343 RepID=UPI001917CE56|nr:Hsp70 family protein [Psychrobacter piscatorii]
MPNNKDWIVSTNIDTNNNLSTDNNIYVGIDFGTSTTVISQAHLEEGRVNISEVPITQPKELGGFIKHYLINSVLAWKNKKLIWGQDAYRLKPTLHEGVNVFSSFKMKLGLAIGPTYPRTSLASSRENTPTIETAEDATREFFKGVLAGLTDELKAKDLSNYRFTFTVPASFEANQRRDLVQSLEANNISENQLCLIDEPNAAFLSFLYECTHKKQEPDFLRKLKSDDANILVYDFGAGTCDISILKVGLTEDSFQSRNLAISKFTALGGDNIDRAIAEHVLMPQLLGSCPEYDPSLRDKEETLIPSLQATAERLKIYVIKWMVENQINSLNELSNYSDIEFTDLPLNSITIKKKYNLYLDEPSLKIKAFRNIMEDFVGDYDGLHTPLHIVSPVADALDKSKLHREDVDAVLFIGGSSQNPLVQECVMDYVNEYSVNAQAIIPSDLRSHVSLGAAIHSFSYHGLDVDFIQPITSETIYIITKNEILETIIPSSSPVPNPSAFETTLIVANREQSSIELPICVGNKNKLLGIITIDSDSKYFNRGDEVKVTASINQEKLLSITAQVSGKTVSSSILNPLSNEELTETESKLLKAKQVFNQDLLDYKGRPRIHVVKKYADMALEAGAYELAAELYQGIERMDSSYDYSTIICHAYDRAGRNNLSKQWAEIAYKRDPNDVNAYNLSIEYHDERREKYLRLSLEHNPNYTTSLLLLGKYLLAKGHPEGEELLMKAKDILYLRCLNNFATKRDCLDLINISSSLDDKNTESIANSALDEINEKEEETKAYDDKNLVQTTNNDKLLKKN